MSSKTQLINLQGQPQFGLFSPPLEEINYRDYDLRSPLDRPLGRLAKHYKYNQFHFAALISPELVVGAAIVDLKYAANAFVYLYEPASGAFEEFSFLQPLAKGTEIEDCPNNGESYFRKGGNSVSISASGGQRTLRVSLVGGVEIDAVIDETEQFNPLCLCTRSGYQGWTYTQKSTARPANGELHWSGRHYDLAAISALGSVDWSAGYMRGETAWNWASMSTTLTDGRRLGLNFAAGVNETSFTENAIWLDDTLIKIDMVDFQFQRYQTDEAWHMQSADGIVNLRFVPAGQRRERINAVFAASNFTQHFGQFYGEICLPDERIAVDGAWGFAEDHYAKW